MLPEGAEPEGGHALATPWKRNRAPTFQEREWMTEYGAYTSAATLLLLSGAVEASWLVFDVLGLSGWEGLRWTVGLNNVLFTSAEWTALSIPLLLIAQRLRWWKDARPRKEPRGVKIESGLDNGDGGGTARDSILQAGEVDPITMADCRCGAQEDLDDEGYPTGIKVPAEDNPLCPVHGDCTCGVDAPGQPGLHYPGCPIREHARIEIERAVEYEAQRKAEGGSNS